MITAEQIEAVGKVLPEELEAYEVGGLVLLIMHAYLDVEIVPELLRAMADDVEIHADKIQEVMANLDKEESDDVADES
jgi:hypothetical protein